jgi:hypothetical protein
MLREGRLFAKVNDPPIGLTYRSYFRHQSAETCWS